MNVFKREMKANRLSLLIWTLVIGFMVALVIILYPEMSSQMEDVSDIFSSMGKFTEAFGMDKLNFGTLVGYYGIEAGNVIGMGAALFAAVLAGNILLKEEKDRTSEFLFTHPISRAKVLTEKLIAIIICILILHLIVFGLSVGSIYIIGKEIPWQEILLLHAAYLLLTFEIAGICFGISAFLNKGGIGIGIGLTAILYFLNIISNITDNAKILKYFTPFGYIEASQIINELELRYEYIIPGMILMVICIIIGYIKYCHKDLRN